MDIDRGPYDIRTRYDIEHIHWGRVASEILQLQPPLECDQTTGLDALVVVIRRIYSFTMFPPDSLTKLVPGWFDEAEKKNPILRLSWQVIGDDPEQASVFREARNELIERFDHGFNAGSASFYELCTSSIMNRTFWGHYAFCLRWHPLHIDTMETVPETADERAATNIIQFDRIAHPNLKLQQAVDNNFGTPKVNSGIIYLPNRPLLIRVLYRTDGRPDDSGKCTTFNNIRQFSLPSWIIDKDLHLDKQGEPSTYTITAVVKLRDETSGRDNVRTYSHNGPNIVAAYEDTSLMPSDWSVTDVGPCREYMLIYAPLARPQRSDLSQVPEHAPASRMDMEARKMVNRVLDPMIAQIKNSRAQDMDGSQEGSSTT
ncbi:hypothetical protein FAVG1_00313 [Fusarium avenaceum]|nr:hypothetical protein FAVG1_00313 [Fusarium avenaceum]